jgi:hypothetical protein
VKSLVKGCHVQKVTLGHIEKILSSFCKINLEFPQFFIAKYAILLSFENNKFQNGMEAFNMGIVRFRIE